MLGFKKAVYAPKMPLLQHQQSSPAIGATVTGSSTPNVKGSWFQLIGSTSHNSYGIWIQVHHTAATNTNTSALLDIGVGPTGNEQVLIPDLGVGYKLHELTSTVPATWFFPIYIPSGSRISGRVQGVQASKNVTIKIILLQSYDPYMWVGSGVLSFGVDYSSSRGTIVSPGNATYGTSVEFTSSSPFPLRYFQVSSQGGGSASLADWNMMFRLEVDGSPIISNLPGAIDTGIESTSTNVGNHILSKALFNIQDGSSLSISAMINGTTSSNVLDFILHGVY